MTSDVKGTHVADGGGAALTLTGMLTPVREIFQCSGWAGHESASKRSVGRAAVGGIAHGSVDRGMLWWEAIGVGAGCGVHRGARTGAAVRQRDVGRRWRDVSGRYGHQADGHAGAPGRRCTDGCLRHDHAGFRPRQ